MFQLQARRTGTRASVASRRPARAQAAGGRCGAAAVAVRHSSQSTFINWADESHGFHDECFCRIRATVRETFYRFSIKSVYYS